MWLQKGDDTSGQLRRYEERTAGSSAGGLGTGADIAPDGEYSGPNREGK